tara:strand:+ start:124640 stop:125257 length:618 start_codon:yes stop_codon:yes gene_type:complete
MIDWDMLISSFIVLWAVIDPVGTVPVFLAVTKNYEAEEKKRIAKNSALVAFTILVFFIVVGEVLLKQMGVPLPAFQVSGGIILFIFAVDMIFGNSKPEGEIQMIKSVQETAVFPLAIPSIASPGAILATMLLTDNSRNSIVNQFITTGILALIILITYFLMRSSAPIHKRIGNSGAIVISKVMGLILASIAATNILLGIKEFFKL